jgi:uncharacterized protein
MAHKYLLSIDGGGLRGILPVAALVQLERTTGRRTRETFSFVAGTSTGAIIAAAIAAGIPAQQILELYIHRSQGIFSQDRSRLLQRIVSGSMYSTQKLHDLTGQSHLKLVRIRRRSEVFSHRSTKAGRP